MRITAASSGAVTEACAIRRPTRAFHCQTQSAGQCDHEQDTERWHRLSRLLPLPPEAGTGTMRACVHGPVPAGFGKRDGARTPTPGQGP